MCALSTVIRADEGMWIPASIPDSVFFDMKKKGLNLSKEQIFSNDSTSLSYAMVKIKGCSGGFISGDGLVLTNYHCIRHYVQQNSTLQSNLFEQGFSATSIREELPCRGITVEVIKKIKDVTDEMLCGVDSTCTIDKRDSVVRNNISKKKKSTKQAPGSKLSILPFYFGNKYYMFEAEEYTDVRLVYVPTQKVAEFGGDSDNWQWPNHRVDMAILRVYADTSFRTSGFNSNNIPIKPKRFLNIKLSEKKEDDFVMLMGYPGLTEEYLPRKALLDYRDRLLPLRVKMMGLKMNSIDKIIRTDSFAYLNYKAKYLSVSNYYIKSKSDLASLQDSSLVVLKDWFYQKISPSIAQQLDSTYMTSNDLESHYSFFLQGILSLYVIRMTNKLLRFADDTSRVTGDNVVKIKEQVRSFHKTYNPAIDLEFFKELVPLLKEYREIYPQFILTNFYWGKGNLKVEMKNERIISLFKKSIFLDSTKFDETSSLPIEKFMQAIRNDFVFKLTKELFFVCTQQIEKKKENQKGKLDSLQRINMSCMGDYASVLYPDANQTLRLSSGIIKSYNYPDAVRFNYQNFTEGVKEKHMTKHEDYAVDTSYLRFVDQHRRFPYCFIANCHTTGGNSGSPVVDGNGNLVGLNFDRNRHGCVNDYIYDLGKGRNIMLDTRYIVLMLKEYSHANHVLQSLQFAE